MFSRFAQIITSNTLGYTIIRLTKSWVLVIE